MPVSRVALRRVAGVTGHHFWARWDGWGTTSGRLGPVAWGGDHQRCGGSAGRRLTGIREALERSGDARATPAMPSAQPAAPSASLEPLIRAWVSRAMTEGTPAFNHYSRTYGKLLRTLLKTF